MSTRDTLAILLALLAVACGESDAEHPSAESTDSGAAGASAIDASAGAGAAGISGASGFGAASGAAGIGNPGGTSGAGGASGTAGSPPLGFPPGGPADPSCTGPGGEAGTHCGGIADAHVANAVNVGYYPFKIKAGVTTALHSCPNRVLETLVGGQGFAAQSTRNPSCSDNPELRPSLNGFVFGYARGSGRSGWVPASALEFAGYVANSCADGPAGVDFQVAKNPHAGCQAFSCNGATSCKAANGSNDGKSDCGGKTLNVVKTVSAQDMYLRYAPLSTPTRYLHQGDKVKVLYDNLKGWSFVHVLESSCPELTPVGARGWCQTEHLK